jgi:hypothetical protein
MALLSVAFFRTEITPWTKFIFEDLKVVLSGSSPPFLKLPNFRDHVWKTPFSVLMQIEMLLNQLQFLNYLKVPFQYYTLSYA